MVNKRIILVTSEFPPQPGGIGMHAFQLAKSLYKKNYQILVITDQRSQSGEYEVKFDRDVPFEVIRIKRRSLRPIMYVSRVLTLNRTIKTNDVIIASGKFSLWNVAFNKFLTSVKTIGVIHGTEVNLKTSLSKKLVELSLKRFDEIIAVSNYTKGLVSHLNRQIVVIPNGINASDWECKPNELKLLQGSPVLITVGRLSERKGQLQVIKHLPELIKSYPEIHYHCVGMDNLKDDYLNASKRLGVETHISFHGIVSKPELIELLCSSDVLLMLSKEDKQGDVEGFGIAILEANALGVPAIGSKNCGIEDAILEGISGKLIHYNNSEELVSALDNILNNYTDFKQESLKWAKGHDWNIIVNQYIKLLE